MKSTCLLIGILCGTVGSARAAGPARDVWQVDASGTARCDLAADRPTPCVMEMHAQGVLVHAELPTPLESDWTLELGWPILRPASDLRGGLAKISRTGLPAIIVDGAAMKRPARRSYRYDGVLTIDYAPHNGIALSCALFPSTTLRAVMEQWTIENRGNAPVKIAVAARRETLGEPVDAMDRPNVLERNIAGIDARQILPGGKATCAVVYTLRQRSAAALTPDVVREKELRQTMFRKAREAMALKTPEPLLDGTFILAKMRLLEAPVESAQGLIQGTGTRSYLGGTWTNDNVEYAAPACPGLGDPVLNTACENMFALWLKDNSAHISPSYESYRLRQVGYDRGDQAMMMYGLSNYLLARGDIDTARRFWPLIEKSVRLTRQATRSNGIVASRTDELEGRYPTGTANLSTSSLAYGGYRAAARLAKALGKDDEAADYQARSDALAKAIESYFGAEVEGYKTYRYFDGCQVLRGWICLPLAMGIMERKEGTLNALFSEKLWSESPAQFDAGIKVVSTDRSGGWPRETYYALRAAFKAGDTQRALQKTIVAARRAMLGPLGPYMDEDGGDLLAPNVLYLRVITEGLFGIEPLGLDRFGCTPRLPARWPGMSLRNVCMMGRNLDLVVERAADKVRLNVTTAGKIVFSQTRVDGTPFEIDLSKINSQR